ncbi:MAG: hypothetical protein IJW13_03895 [Clostridia bacterium]|nr:hypothetical protein [Clostridia bacterium]
MFCKFCGKKTENLNGVCNDCASKPNSLTTPIVIAGGTYVCNEYDAKYGLSSAIASVVLTVVSVFLSVIAYAISIVTIANAAVGSRGNLFLVNLVITIGATVCAIIGFIKGISAIKDFKHAKANGAKPVATLVLGINAIIGSPVAWILNFFALLFCLITLFA